MRVENQKKNSSLRRLNFMFRKLVQKCFSRIPSQDNTCEEALQPFKGRLFPYSSTNGGRLSLNSVMNRGRFFPNSDERRQAFPQIVS
jgi:hypothetical protein